ncbi:MAG: MFS transporter [Promethearchaeota archaeon]
MTSQKLEKRVIFSVFLLHLSGSTAFGVENSFFNVFMYNIIAPNTVYVAIIVTASAITATVTSIIMGTLSDKIGARKKFFIISFPLWGLTTSLFAISGVLSPILFAVFVATLFDCLMTFFGSTAYDAVLKAYITDVTSLKNRGFLSSFTEIAGLISILITYGMSSLIIELYGFYVFFILIGVVVGILGTIGAFSAKEPKIQPLKDSYFELLKSTFTTSSIKKDRDLWLTLIGIMVWGIGLNTCFPYLLIYLEHYIKMSIIEAAGIVLVAIIIAAISSVPIGKLIDKFGRKPFAILSIIGCSISLILFSLVKSLIFLGLFSGFFIITMIVFNISVLTWFKDLQPENKRGQFAGLSMIFSVAISQSLGSIIGSLIASNYGVPIIIDNKPGWVPPPLIFVVSAVIVIFTLIPIIFAKGSIKSKNVEIESKMN